MAFCISLHDGSSYHDMMSDVIKSDNIAPIGVVIHNLSGQILLDNKEIAGNWLLSALQNILTLEYVT